MNCKILDNDTKKKKKNEDHSVPWTFCEGLSIATVLPWLKKSLKTTWFIVFKQFPFTSGGFKEKDSVEIFSCKNSLDSKIKFKFMRKKWHVI